MKVVVRFVKQSSDRWQRLHGAEDIIEVVSITVGGTSLKILEFISIYDMLCLQ